MGSAVKAPVRAYNGPLFRWCKLHPKGPERRIAAGREIDVVKTAPNLRGRFYIKNPERMVQMKEAICTGIGVAGSAIAALFGGWDAALITLMIFMGIDYLTGLIVAGVFHTSEKTENGTLESRAGWKGLCRKGVSLLIVLVACRLDVVMGSNFIRDAVVIAFIANETLSIIENAGLMGVPIPAIIVKAVEVLKKKAESEGGEK